MAIKKIQMIPPGYTDIVHPETSADNIIETDSKKVMTGDERIKLGNIPSDAVFTDTVYSHPPTHPASMITDLPTGKKVARFVIGTSTAGWTAADCDYLCNGTADQTEINAAITALPATGGEIVILDGTYNITAKIDVTKNNVSIRGNGSATILKRMFSTASGFGGIITLTGRSGCKIADLRVYGNKTSYSGYGNFGIYLESSSNNTITGNTCNNDREGIYLYSSNNNIIIGNTCNNNNNSGIYLESSSYNTITDNTCSNNSYGIYLYSSNNNIIIGNTCNNNNNSGIRLYSSSNNTVTGNTCYYNRYYGIHLDYSSNNNTITGNACSEYNDSGIRLYSSSDNTVTGNTCNNNSYGIHLASSSNSTVVGNTCNDNYSGFQLTSSSNNTITGNTCIRGTGLATNYYEINHTIRLEGTSNSYNLISNNNCMGKAVTNEGGTGNTLVNNKFDAS